MPGISNIVNNNVNISEPLNQANLFASFFQSVFVNCSVFNPNVPICPLNTINIPCISVDQVKTAIKSLISKRTSGLDGIPSFIIKGLGDILAPILTVIFNTSLKNMIFPTLWKSAVVVPIFKSGDRSCVSNYRPISLSNVLCKVFERVVHSILTPLIYPLLDPCQHGFRPSFSTVTNLISFLSKITPAVSEYQQVDAINLDLKKAFDRVDHGILLRKLLNNFHFSCPLVRWFQNYLSNRVCRIRVSSSLSNPFIASSGVPQGSILGPILFLLFINDLGVGISSDYELFADDFRLYRVIKNNSSCCLLQQDLTLVESWARSNNMMFNVDKSHVITFCRSSNVINFPYSLCGSSLSFVNSSRNLGVLLNKKLTFHDHITNQISVASRSLGLILNISHGLSLECLLCLYKAIVRPCLEYAVPVWNHIGVTRSRNIELVQRRFVRAIYSRYMYRRVFYSYESMCTRLGLEPLNRRRTAYEALFLIRVLNGEISCQEVLNQVHVLPPGRRAGRWLYIKQLSPLSPLVRFVSVLNSLPINSTNLQDFLSLRLILKLLATCTAFV